MQGKIIFYEINEVHLSVLERYVSLYPNSAISKLYQNSSVYQTVNTGTGHLSPWVTWPTLHRGINNAAHHISDFEQHLAEVDKAYPSFLNILAENQLKIVFLGSLRTFPLPENVTDYAFYIPDTFANGSQTYPAMYESFQALNLFMTKKSGRNIDKHIPIREAFHFLKDMPKLGITFSTFKKCVIQLFSQVFNRTRANRRRTPQAQIAFDLYCQLLLKEQPDLSTFLTNHVASAMYSYWPEAFPEEYKDFSMPLEWQNTYKDEIWFAMREADDHVKKLLDLVNKHKEYILVLASSMGQSAVQASVKISNQLLLVNPNSMMSFFGLDEQVWSQKLAMAPQYTFQFTEKKYLNRYIEALSNVLICGTAIDHQLIGDNSVRIFFYHNNLGEADDILSFKNASVTKDILGPQIVDIQDESGSYAYHISEGILLVHNGSNQKLAVDSFPATQMAPSLLSHFNISIPEYMDQPLPIF